MSDAVLVTGAAGFLGSHLCERFLNEGYVVVGVDNFCTGQKKNVDFLKNMQVSGSLSNAFVAERFYFLEGDVCKPWREWTAPLPDFVIKKLKYVLHFASPASPPHYQRLAKETMWVNSMGTQQVLELADRMGARAVFASTSEIYGDPEVTPQPESYVGYVNTVGPRSCYDEAKRFGEALIFTHNQKLSTRHGMVRIFNTYGPRMNPEDGRVIINFLVQALRGQPLSIYGTGLQTRSFCYVTDLVEAIVTYAKSDLTQPINIGNDHEFTILELTKVVQEIFAQQKLTHEFLPLPKDDPKQRRPDLTLAFKQLAPWTPKVSIKEGLVQMLASLRQELQ